jgi:NAD(P)-dependent dehydrogenase (short-subunit alcohol dehydrogenase family)
MIAVTGYSTTVIRKLEKLRHTEEIVRIRGDLRHWTSPIEIPDADRFVLAHGLLHQKPFREQSEDEVLASIHINLLSVMRLCERILTTREDARICVIGSESGFNGSYDDTYAVSKAGVHLYVQSRRVGPRQLLACVAPPIIADSGMTRRRHDYPEVLKYRRHVYAWDVALAINRLLWHTEPGQTVLERL